LRRRACGARSLTSSLSLDRCGQGRADAPRLRGSAAHRPERLESYRSPLIISVGRCTSLWRCHPSRGTRTPVRSAIPARPRQRPLGPHRTRSVSGSPPGGFEPVPTKDASGQLVHPTLSKTSTRTPRGYRLARSSSMRPIASRLWPRFGRLSPPGSDGVRAGVRETRGPTSDARVALRCPGIQAGSSFGPMPLLLPPRERRRFPRHRTSSATKEPSSGPSDAPGVATRSVLSTSLHRWLPFFAVLLPLAESPWAPPAATGGACLDLTPLDDFCNHTKGRAHRANVRSSHDAPFLGHRSPSAPKDPGNRER
jgi:hypothetical protein